MDTVVLVIALMSMGAFAFFHMCGFIALHFGKYKLDDRFLDMALLSLGVLVVCFLYGVAKVISHILTVGGVHG